MQTSLQHELTANCNGEVNFSNFVENSLKLFIWISIGLFVYEVAVLKTENSLQSFSFFIWSERVIASIFTIELVLRWIKSAKQGCCPWYKRYPFNWFGLIDALSIIPFYIGFIFYHSAFAAIRSEAFSFIRLLRVFRFLKLFRYNILLQNLAVGFWDAREKLKLVLSITTALIITMSAFIFHFEGKAQPDVFTSFFDSVWWSIVTISTVGYGDMSPITTIGKVIAEISILVGILIFGLLVSVLTDHFEWDSLSKKRKQDEM